MPDQKSLSLPCGTSATVRAFNGNAQRRITEQLSTGQLPDADLKDQLLREVVLELGSLTAKGSASRLKKALEELPTGSRVRLMLEARRLAYGDELAIELVCSCSRKLKQSVSLAEVDDVAYPDGLPEFEHTAGDGLAYAFGWGTGTSEYNFEVGRRAKRWGVLDEPLSLITKVAGQPKGPLYFQELSAGLLEELRRVGRARAPTRYLSSDPLAQRPVRLRGGREVDVPVAGPRTRWEFGCDGCGASLFCFLEGQRDFLLPFEQD